MDLLKLKNLIVLLLLAQSYSYGQDWTSFESQNQINDLVDNGTELFMATDAGLVVMNKATLTKTLYDVSNSDLPFNHVQSITEGVNGEIWIGTYDVNVARFDNGNFIAVEAPQPAGIPINTELYDIKVAPNGDLWCGIKGGVLQKQGATWIFHGPSVLGAGFFEAWDVEIDAAGDVFVGARDVHKFSGGVWSIITSGVSIEGYLDADLFFGSDGTLYFAGDLAKIGRYDGTSWIEDSVGFTINNFISGKFAEDQAGDVYFNTAYSGILKFDNTDWNLISNAQTMAYDNRIDYFHIDDQDNYWMNKNIQLSVNRNSVIENTRISEHTLESASTNGVRSGANGKVYFLITSGENISVVDENGNWSMIPLPANPGFFIYDILALADDNIWLAASGGLFQYDGNTWTQVATDLCRSFAQDSQGKVYVLSNNKVIILDNGSISEYNPSNSGISALNLTGHGIDNDDNLWIAAGGFTNDNLIQKRESNGTWTTYLEVDFPILRRPTGDFTFDDEGNVYVVDDVAGVIMFDGTTFTNPIMDNMAQIESIYISSIAIDENGKLFFAHPYGFVTMENGSFEDLLVPNVPFNTNTGSSCTIDNTGNLWWASERYGVHVYEKEITSGIRNNEFSAIDFNVFPNPATSFVKVNFEVKGNVDANVNLFNSIGQVMRQLPLGQQTTGTQEYALDLSDLPSGMYILQLQMDGVSSSKTLLVR